jgi:hypothetical protein
MNAFGNQPIDPALQAARRVAPQTRSRAHLFLPAAQVGERLPLVVVVVENGESHGAMRNATALLGKRPRK